MLVWRSPKCDPAGLILTLRHRGVLAFIDSTLSQQYKVYSTHMIYELLQLPYLQIIFTLTVVCASRAFPRVRAQGKYLIYRPQGRLMMYHIVHYVTKNPKSALCLGNEIKASGQVSACNQSVVRTRFSF